MVAERSRVTARNRFGAQRQRCVDRASDLRVSARELPPCDHERYHLDMATEIVPGITADPAHAFGKPVIAGTRVPAALVLGLLAAGRPETEIASEYELTAEQIRATLRYAAWLADQQSLRAS